MTSDAYHTSDDAEAIYNGTAQIGTFNRSNVNGQSFTLVNVEEEQFIDAIERIHTTTPVYVWVTSKDSDLKINGQEFLLKRISSSTRRPNSFALQCEDLDDSLYEKVSKWKKDETQLYAIIVKGEIVAEERVPSGDYKDFAIAIRSNALLNDVSFLSHVGSERKYMDWLRGKRCCLSGSFYKDLETGNEYCDPAHVRMLHDDGGGMALKPPYQAVPLHHKLHQWQHQYSMTELWKTYAPKGCPKNQHYRRLAPHQSFPIYSEKEAAHAFFMYKVHEYQRKWVIAELLRWAGIKRLSHLSPEKFEKYLIQNSLQQHYNTFI